MQCVRDRHIMCAIIVIAGGILFSIMNALAAAGEADDRWQQADIILPYGNDGQEIKKAAEAEALLNECIMFDDERKKFSHDLHRRGPACVMEEAASGFAACTSLIQETRMLNLQLHAKRNQIAVFMARAFIVSIMLGLDLTAVSAEDGCGETERVIPILSCIKWVKEILSWLLLVI